MEEKESIPKGTTLKVYRFLLKHNKLIGAREIQRRLNFSSPSLALYHLNKLEDAEIVRKENGKYKISKIMLDQSIRLSRFLIPRFLFYAMFVFSALIIQLTYLRPQIITSNYFFSTVVIVSCTIFFVYETIKAWLKNNV